MDEVAENIDAVRVQPVLSVVITAFSRQDFLLHAVKSVLGQDIPRHFYEIIVIKNFSDPYIDEFLSNEYITVISPDKEIIGYWFTLGIRRSRGNIVCFLEDDDMFMSNKLSSILRTFNEYPTLMYYHNAHILMDDRGQMKDRGMYSYEEKRVANTSKLTNREIGELLYYHADFNVSSIAIRKQLLFSKEDVFSRSPTSLDTFLFFCALDLDCSIMIDNEQLTVYRVHKSETHNIGKNDKSRDKSFSKSSAARFLKARELMLQATTKKVPKESALGFYVESKLTHFIETNDGDSAPSLGDFMALLRCSVFQHRCFYWLLLVETLLYFIAPEAVVRIDELRRQFQYSKVQSL